MICSYSVSPSKVILISSFAWQMAQPASSSEDRRHPFILWDSLSVLLALQQRSSLGLAGEWWKEAPLWDIWQQLIPAPHMLSDITNIPLNPTEATNGWLLTLVWKMYNSVVLEVKHFQQCSRMIMWGKMGTAAKRQLGFPRKPLLKHGKSRKL